MKSSEGFAFVRPGLHLYYRILGEGPETVVVPNANWLADLLHPLAEGRRLIFYDPRSRGRSSAVTRRRGTSPSRRTWPTWRRCGATSAWRRWRCWAPPTTPQSPPSTPSRTRSGSTRLLLVCPITPRHPGGVGPGGALLRGAGLSAGHPAARGDAARGDRQEDPVAYCRAWFTLLPAPGPDGRARRGLPLPAGRRLLASPTSGRGTPCRSTSSTSSPRWRIGTSAPASRRSSSPSSFSRGRTTWCPWRPPGSGRPTRAMPASSRSRVPATTPTSSARRSSSRRPRPSSRGRGRREPRSVRYAA